jgi:hypothetical protein
VGAASDEEYRSLLVGESRPLQFAADERRLEVTRPDGSVWVARRDQASGESVVYGETDLPGIYHLRVAGRDGSLRACPERDFVVNLDPRESNPARLAPERRPDRVAARPGVARPKYRAELWHVLAGVLIGLLLLESLLTVRRRRPVLASDRAGA